VPSAQAAPAPAPTPAFVLRPLYPRVLPSPWTSLRRLGEEALPTTTDTRSIGAAVAACDPYLSVRNPAASPSVAEHARTDVPAQWQQLNDAIAASRGGAAPHPGTQAVAIILPSESSGSQDGGDSPNGVWLPHSSATVSTIVASLGASGGGGGDASSGSNGNTRSSNEVSATVTADSREGPSGRRSKSKAGRQRSKSGKRSRNSKRSRDAADDATPMASSSKASKDQRRQRKEEAAEAKSRSHEPPSKRTHTAERRKSSRSGSRRGSSRGLGRSLAASAGADPKAKAMSMAVPSHIRPGDLYTAADAFGKGSLVVPRSLGRIGAVAILRAPEPSDAERRSAAFEAAAANRRAAVVVIHRPSQGHARFDSEARRPILWRWTLPAETRPPAAGFDPPTSK